MWVLHILRQGTETDSKGTATRSYCFVITFMYVVVTAGHIWRQRATGSFATGLVMRRRSCVVVRSVSVNQPFAVTDIITKELITEDVVSGRT